MKAWMKASRILLITMAVSPAILFGQKKEDFLQIQRDVASMDDRIKQMQKSTDEKLAALTALVQGLIDQSNKTSGAMTGMQKNVDEKLTEQQTKLVAPLATLGTKVDEMSGDFRSVRENVAELVRRVNDLDTKLTDISSTVRSIQVPVAPPPAVVPAGGVPLAAGGTTAQQSPDTPPPGMSAELSYTAALGDYNGKKDDLAIEEFAQYLRYYPQSANAPNAQYYIGQIYYRTQNWADAAKAFDAVLEKFPKNAKTADAQYYKACSLMNNKDRTAAASEFKSFIKNYPDNPKVAEAHKHLQTLGMEVQRRRTK